MASPARYRWNYIHKTNQGPSSGKKTGEVFAEDLPTAHSQAVAQLETGGYTVTDQETYDAMVAEPSDVDEYTYIMSVTLVDQVAASVA